MSRFLTVNLLYFQKKFVTISCKFGTLNVKSKPFIANKKDVNGFQYINSSITDSAASTGNDTLFSKHGTYNESSLWKSSTSARAAVLLLQAETALKLPSIENSERLIIKDVANFLRVAFPGHARFYSLAQGSTGTDNIITYGINKTKVPRLIYLANHPENPRIELQHYIRRLSTYNDMLASWVDIQIARRDVNILRTLQQERQYSREHVGLQKGIFVQNRAIYALLLQYAAQNNNWSEIKFLLSCMRNDALEPSMECRTTVLECFGRLIVSNILDCHNYNDLLDDVKFCLNTIDGGLETLRQYLSQSLLSKSDVKSVIRSVQLFYPDFQFVHNLKDAYFASEYEDHAVTSSLTKVKLSSHGSFAGVINGDQLLSGFCEQLNIEHRGEVEVIPVASAQSQCNSTEHYVSSQRVKYLKEALEQLKLNWRELLATRFKQLLLKLSQGHTKNFRITLYPYIAFFPEEYYVDIMLTELDRMIQDSSFGHVPGVEVFHRIGAVIEQRYRFACFAERSEAFKRLYSNYLGRYAGSETGEQHEQRLDFLFAAEEEDAMFFVRPHLINWSYTTCQQLGRILYQIMFETLRFSSPFHQDISIYYGKSKTKMSISDLPALFETIDESAGTPSTVVRVHPELIRWVTIAEPTVPLRFTAEEMPMLCPPRPWMGSNSAGYLFASGKNLAAQIIRQTTRSPSLAVFQEDGENPCQSLSQRMAPVFDAVNSLAACAWRVNEPLLDVALQVFRAGGDLSLSIPLHSSKLNIPSQSSMNSSVETPEDRRAFRRINDAMLKQRNEQFSLWSTALYRLSIAEHLRKHVFWLPHSMDFRGRVYPVPPHLQHMGGDLSRALLLFARGQPLGKRGLYWLKIHLVNIAGLAKRQPLESRLALADTFLPDIFDSADKPLSGRGWWRNDEDPWQTLACCMELAAALRSPNPEEFVSHFPVHQDGSCNGLQHYAALGRDALGAATVNLTPSAFPNDVYQDVVELVEARRASDAAAGNEISKVLEGFVLRKVIKQSVMTTVYGVTEYGARLQIKRQLLDMNFPQEHLSAACSYLARLTLKSIGQIFTSSRDIQSWFGQIANQIAVTRGVPMRWETPLGQPVRQPYLRRDGSLDLSKQRSAFPPNFVHSLDSSHMMLTALHCQRLGITFASVHDCYWTHAASVDAMNIATRDQFVALHSEEILEHLAADLRQRFGYSNEELEGLQSKKVIEAAQQLNQLLGAPPVRGTFCLNLVRDSTYFFC